MKQSVLFALVFTPWLASGQPQPPQPASTLKMGAQIFGRVQSEAGTAIPGARVTAIRQPTAPLAKEVPFAASHVARPDGSFAFTGLNPGAYVVCAQLAQSTWLNPCEWGGKALVVNLAAEQIVTTVVLSMKKGVVVPIRLDDPGKLLAQHTGKTSGAEVLIGVVTDAGHFLPAEITGTDSTGRNHQVLVPVGGSVNLSVFSSFFQLADNTGSALLKSGTALPVAVAAGQTPTQVTISIKGTNP